MAGQRLTGAAAQTEAIRALTHSRADIESSLAPFEPRSTFEVWFSTFRGIEELINLPGELRGEPLLDEIGGLALLDVDGALRALPSIKAGLESRFSRLVAKRLMQTLIQLQAIAISFAMHQLPAARELATVGTAIGYLQSRRRHLLAFLHTIPGVCRGTQRLHELDGLNQFLYLIETAGLGTTSMHHNLMLALVYPDFALDARVPVLRRDTERLFVAESRPVAFKIGRPKSADQDATSERLLSSDEGGQGSTRTRPGAAFHCVSWNRSLRGHSEPPLGSQRS